MYGLPLHGLKVIEEEPPPVTMSNGIASANMGLVVLTNIQADEFVLSVYRFAPIFRVALYLNFHHNDSGLPRSSHSHPRSGSEALPLSQIDQGLQVLT